MPIRVATSVHEEDVACIQEWYNTTKGADDPALEVLPDYKGFYIRLPVKARRFEDAVKMVLWRYPVQKPRAVLHYEGVSIPTSPNALSPVFNYTPFTAEEEQRVCRCMGEVFGQDRVKYYPSISSVWQSSPEQLPVFLGTGPT